MRKLVEWLFCLLGLIQQIKNDSVFVEKFSRTLPDKHTYFKKSSMGKAEISYENLAYTVKCPKLLKFKTRKKQIVSYLFLETLFTSKVQVYKCYR